MSANKAFFILIISSLLVLFGLATVSIKTIPLLLSHAVYVCQETFSNIIFSVSQSVPLLIMALVIVIVLIGLITLAIQVLKTRAFLKINLNNKALITSASLGVIEELNLGDRIDLVKDQDKFSFCYGLLKPRICLSMGLIKSLSLDELRAVLLHESYHIQNHDPLKIILSQTACVMFFFIPILKEIQQYFALSKEIAADKMAIKYGERKSLISVLNKLLVAPAPRFNGVAALASLDHLEKRILYLAGNQKKAIFRPSPISISLSAFIVLFSMVLVNTPVYAVRADDSCKAKEEASYSKDLMYTPATYTPK